MSMPTSRDVDRLFGTHRFTPPVLLRLALRKTILIAQYWDGWMDQVSCDIGACREANDVSRSHIVSRLACPPGGFCSGSSR
jgi:hypothetical protein